MTGRTEFNVNSAGHPTRMPPAPQVLRQGVAAGPSWPVFTGIPASYIQGRAGQIQGGRVLTGWSLEKGLLVL